MSRSEFWVMLAYMALLYLGTLAVDPVDSFHSRSTPTWSPTDPAWARWHSSRIPQAEGCSVVEAEIEFGRRIGGGANPPESELFTRIVDVEIGSEGHTYVLDAGEARIQVYDTEGSFSHRFGGRGQGPGEFRTPVAMAVGDSSVYVLDGGAGLQVFSKEGGYRRLIRLDYLPQLASPVSIDVSDGSIYLGLRYVSLPNASPEPRLYGVLILNTGTDARQFVGSVTSSDLQEGSYRNIPTIRREVAAVGGRVAVADNWHREISVLSSGGEEIGTFDGCLPIDPNAEDRPETAAEGRVGGWGVTGDIDPVGQTHFARFVSYASPERDIPQMVEVFDSESLTGRAVRIPPAGNQWRRFTTAAIQGRRIVFASLFDGTVQWATLPGEVFVQSGQEDRRR